MLRKGVVAPVYSPRAPLMEPQWSDRGSQDPVFRFWLRRGYLCALGRLACDVKDSSPSQNWRRITQGEKQ